MLISLQQYDVTIRYRPGNEMNLGNTLLRLPSIQHNNEIPTDLHVDCMTSVTPSWPEYVERLRAFQCCYLYTASPTINGLMHPETSPDDPKFLDMRDDLSSDNGLTLKVSCIIIPPSVRESFLHDINEEHSGIAKSKLTTHSLTDWPNMDNKI